MLHQSWCTLDALSGIVVAPNGNLSHSANEQEIWHVTSFTGQGRAKYPLVMVGVCQFVFLVWLDYIFDNLYPMHCPKSIENPLKSRSNSPWKMLVPLQEFPMR